jgi:hypothetical protein
MSKSISKKILIKFIITFFTLLFLLLFNNKKIIAESPATPDPEISKFPSILIDEVNFKNSKHDWIMLYVVNDFNNGQGASIKGMQIQDDSIFFTIQEDLFVKTGDFIIIKFKNEKNSYIYEDNILNFYITKKGLTGTTEQVILKDNLNNIIDAVCWANTSPTQTEVEDFNELIIENEWTPDQISNCINSENITSEESIKRTNYIDTNSKNDWIINRGETINELNEKDEEKSEKENNDNNDKTESNKKNETNQTKKDDKSNKDSSKSKKEDKINFNKCLLNIHINEIFPNPKGEDSKNEWIELINEGDETCEIEGMKIDDEEGGSKPYEIKNKIIIKKGFLILPSWETKLTLNNKKDSVRLILPNNLIKEEVIYENAEENSSYAKNKDGEFEWSNFPTPLLSNIFSNNKNLNQKKKNNNKKDKIKKIIENGDLSEFIQLTEIFPNPQGTDSGKEWIEIFNSSDQDINLGNWKIDTGDKSGKKFVFENLIIKAHEFLTLSDKDLKFSLKNSNLEIRLIDFKNNVIDSINYEESEENKSYAKINIVYDKQDSQNLEYKKESKWEWTKNITKNAPNRTIFIYEGEIINYNEMKAELELKTKKAIFKIKVINEVDETDFLLENIFRKGNLVKIYTYKNNKGDLLLENYEILKEKQNPQESNEHGSYIYFAISAIPPLGFFSYFGVKKFGLKILG